MKFLDGKDTEFKKGDIVTAEFLVTGDSNKDDMQVARNSEWKLVRRALDLSKPVRFIDPDYGEIVMIAPASTPNSFLCEVKNGVGFSLARIHHANDLENIPDGDS